MTDLPFLQRVAGLQAQLREQEIAVALVTDRDAVYFLSGFHGYLHMEFGRPTVLAVPREGDCVLVTPAIELEMAERMAPWARVEPWQDGLGDEWRGPLRGVVAAAGGGPIGV